MKKQIVTIALLLLMPLTSVAEQAAELETVTVTGQRRTELLQNTPVTMNVFNASFITETGAQSLGDIDNFSPGLEVISISATHPKFKMRGIGTTDFGIGTDPSVSVYQDDAYLGRSGGALLQFTDIKRIEVLKGPQGTLYGRNSAAGTIHIITQQPVNEVSGSLRLRAGNYDKKLVEGVFNTPIIADTLLLRVNAIYNQRNGFIKSANGGKDLLDEKYQGLRASLLWRATDETELQYTFEANEVDQQAPPSIGLHPILSASPHSLSGKVANDVMDGRDERSFQAHTVKLQHDFSLATMTWISSYREFTSALREDEDGTDKPFTYLDSKNAEENRLLSHELRFNGETGDFSWVGGLYYANEHAEQALQLTTYTNTLNAVAQGSLPVAPFPNLPLPDDLPWLESVENTLKSQSIAAFADATWGITEKLDLTLGARYTRDKKNFSWFNLSNNVLGVGFDQLFQSPTYPLASKNIWVDKNKSWNNISPRAVAAYQFSDSLMSFISYSKGYKAGGFNALQIASSFDPETVGSIEWGVKSSWLNHRLRLNASLFHYDFNDKQDIHFEQQGGAGTFVTRTGDAKSHGAELELDWLAQDNLRLGLNYSYLNATWKQRTVNAFNYAIGENQEIDLTDKALITPKHHAVVTLDYDYSLQSWGRLLFHLDHNYTSKQQFNPAYADYYLDYKNRDASQQFTNMRMTWHPQGKQWRVALWIENMFDNRYAYNIVPVTAALLGTPYINSRKPRLFGAEVIVDF